MEHELGDTVVIFVLVDEVFDFVEVWILVEDNVLDFEIVFAVALLVVSFDVDGLLDFVAGTALFVLDGALVDDGL